MMKEEKAVRDWKNAAGVDSRLFMREVTALIRAVRLQEREKCAKTAEEMGKIRENAYPTYYRAGCEIAAAIRRG